MAVGQVDPEWVARVVELVRRTRTHPDLRFGSSVRGALDATAVVSSLAALRGRPVTSPDVGLDAVLVALSGRVRLREGCTRTAEDIITELWFEVFGEQRADEVDGDADAAGKASAPTGASPS
jgi:MoxR-like ATPase